MTKVFSAHSVSVDGYITGRDPGPGRGLGDGGVLFDWYGDDGGPHPTAPLFVLSHRPAPGMSGRQTLVRTGPADPGQDRDRGRGPGRPGGGRRQ